MTEQVEQRRCRECDRVFTAAISIYCGGCKSARRRRLNEELDAKTVYNMRSVENWMNRNLPSRRNRPQSR